VYINELPLRYLGMVYNKFSEYLKKRYGTKVYKLPVNLSTSCPNRDGTIRMNAVGSGWLRDHGTDGGEHPYDHDIDGGEHPYDHDIDGDEHPHDHDIDGDEHPHDHDIDEGEHPYDRGIDVDGRSHDQRESGSGYPHDPDTGEHPYDHDIAMGAHAHCFDDTVDADADEGVYSGCIFCGIEGAGFEALPPEISIRNQLEENRRYIGAKFGAGKFIAYFQNFSNTYLPFDTFTKAMNEACIEGIVALYIATRPDCIDDRRIDFLRQLKEEKGVDIVVELGLQSVNHHTLRWLNRGHGLAEFIDAVLRIKRAGLEVCTHMISDLPADDINDVIESAKVLSALGTDQVKCHSLYILENTVLGEAYKEGRFRPLSMDEFIDRTIGFLEYLDPKITVQRLLGRSPTGRSLFCNWYTSWWKIHDAIVKKMLREGRYQGRLFNYLNGSALKHLNSMP
jgi:radical SAM protein (TIGR01212 family)